MYESQFEEKLYNERREKLRQIAELGQKNGLSYGAATYPNSFTATHTVPELRAAYDAITSEQFEADLAVGKKIEVAIAGRIMAIRVQGKAGFAQLQQAGQRMQIYVRKDDVGEDAFALYKLLDLGDHVGVSGYMMRTRTGELTVHVSALTFLAKAMLALPDKFHGLEDTELRYRQRYVDLFVNPDVREVFVKRAAVLRALRTFFDSRGYLEVETPMLHTIAGGAAARPFKTHHNALDIPLSLRIAPELYLKRLVVGGMDRVYEINRNFRNEGISTQHNPEFTMLEFYQAYSNYHDLMKLTQELLCYVATEVSRKSANDPGTPVVEMVIPKGPRVGEIELIDFSRPWQEFSMREAIPKWWNDEAGPRPTSEIYLSSSSMIAWLDTVIPTVWSTREALEMVDTPEYVWRKKFVVFHGALAIVRLQVGRGEPLGKAIADIFEMVAEPHLIQPTIIYDFPLAVSPLSKVKPDEPDWVERFEFYIGGFEVGNAFSELNDPDDQRARFEAQLKERERGDDEAHAMDEDYVRALGYGLPPTAGEGIGIDRLTMILTGSKSIRDVILFPLLRPQGKSAE